VINANDTSCSSALVERLPAGLCPAGFCRAGFCPAGSGGGPVVPPRAGPRRWRPHPAPGSGKI